MGYLFALKKTDALMRIIPHQVYWNSHKNPWYSIEE